MAAEVAVVGGGAVAAATALAAAAQQLRVRHIVPAAGKGGGNRHYALSRRSVAFLRRLGVSAPLLPVKKFILHAGTSGVTLADGSRPLCYMAAEKQLMHALTTCLAEAGIASVAAADIRWQQSKADNVILAIDGERQHTALLAVADGAASPLAVQLGITAEVTDFHQQAVVATVSAPSVAADAAVQWFDDNDIVALLPMGDGLFSLVWSTVAPPPPADTAAALRQRTGMADINVVGESVRAFPLRALTRAVRVAPRTALLGDAAGVVHPLAGQGLNLGLADADTLLQCTQRRLHGDIALGLAAYSRARSRRHSQLQQITKFLLQRRRRAACLLSLANLPLMGRAAIAFANA